MELFHTEYVTVIFKMYFVYLNSVGIFEVSSSGEGRRGARNS